MMISRQRSAFRLPKIKIQKARRKAKPKLPTPERPRITDREEPEAFAGTVQGLKASQPEERLAKALDKSQGVDGYEFRRALGAPRGLPGWFELDFLVSAKGIFHAIECDTTFTHRDKGRKDVLHDAQVLKSLTGQGYQVFPRVIHLDGESDLVDENWTRSTVRRLFG